ncbi:PssE/Cps14G family polysaccharide biosynthesis glycosyltransferase [Bacillus paramycoides]|uniref:PssE/Cps14G family polysaccharide biosynthesis glycosyltransferase n=1 Tax=Bacillus paramycoides TaxID=2026194 RepID=UPI002E1D6C2C|nr:PssE/Cps14G family polysaccharide biosynthesis glycosyltransferase [Bacillus paramycoides]MED0987998.1 PssE/Cps14G family polysaccharide biosynthesis glycosyltransferase [Bacillus paramycoides]
MIFITVGTQKFQFNRLLKEMDELCSANIIQEEIIAQVGYSTYQPTNFKTYKLLQPENMNKYVENASVLITHGGTSSIFNALKKGKKVIVVPRLSQYDEHVDDHQIEICEVLDQKGYVSLVWDIKELKKAIKEIHSKVFNTYNFSQDELVNDIIQFINK